jgi:membrane protein required for colicin V production
MFPDLAAFNGFDWFVVVVLTLSMLISLWRGFSREALSLAGWVIAFIAANLFASEVASLLSGVIANLTGRYIVAWSLVFVCVLLLSGLAARLFSRAVRASGLGLLDRLLGTAFGFLRGLVLIMAIVFVLRDLVPPRDQQLLYQSVLMPSIDRALDWSLRAFDDVRDGELPRLSADGRSA